MDTDKLMEIVNTITSGFTFNEIQEIVYELKYFLKENKHPIK